MEKRQGILAILMLHALLQALVISISNVAYSGLGNPQGHFTEETRPNAQQGTNMFFNFYVNS